MTKGLGREQMARRAAQELRDGSCVDLGLGIPAFVASFLPPGAGIVLRSENGLLGIGPYPLEAEVDATPIDAGKETVTMLPASAVFSGDASFAMIRGGPIDLAILGAMQVSERGGLSSWMIPGKMVSGMGAAMDLAAGARRVVVVMEHASEDGAPRILRECSLPLTGRCVAHRIITDLCVIDVTADGLLLKEVAPGVSAREVQEHTEPTLRVGPDLAVMEFV